MSARSRERDTHTVRAEAAAWLARLRSEERTADDEKGFRAWLAESEAHRAAFEVTNSVFEMAGAAQRRISRTPAPLVTRRHVLRTGVTLAAASARTVCVSRSPDRALIRPPPSSRETSSPWRCVSRRHLP